MEISVGETALLLDVNERTVLNLIKSKKVRAVKVGKRWFVDRASVVAFGKVMEPEWGFSENSEKDGLFSENGAVISEISEISENRHPVSENSERRRVGENSTANERIAARERPTTAGRRKGEREGEVREGVRGLCALNCYRMAVEIFARPAWGRVGLALGGGSAESSAQGTSTERDASPEFLEFPEFAGGPVAKML